MAPPGLEIAAACEEVEDVPATNRAKAAGGTRQEPLEEREPLGAGSGIKTTESRTKMNKFFRENFKVGDQVDYFFDGMRFHNYKFVLADRGLQSATFITREEEVSKRVPVVDAGGDSAADVAVPNGVSEEPEERVVEQAEAKCAPLCLPLDESLSSSSPRLKKLKKSHSKPPVAGDAVEAVHPSRAATAREEQHDSPAGEVFRPRARSKSGGADAAPAARVGVEGQGPRCASTTTAGAAATGSRPRAHTTGSEQAVGARPLATKIVTESIAVEFMERPVWGKAYGWVRGRVVRVWDDENEEGDGIEVEPVDENLCYVECGTGKVDNTGWHYQISHRDEVRKVLSQEEHQQVKSADAAPAPAPLLSIFMARWYDYWTYRKSSEYKITCNYPMQALIDEAGVRDAIGNDFECYMLFVKDEACLRTFYVSDLSDCMSRGSAHKVGLYYLWPTQKYLGRARRTHEHHARYNDDGMVPEGEFFAFCQKVEDLDIKTKYPAPSSVYRQLCGKQYYNAACLNVDLQVPATTRVFASSIRSNARRAAADAIFALEKIRRYQEAQGMAVPGAGAPQGGAAPRDARLDAACDGLALSLSELMPEENDEQILPEEVKAARARLLRETAGVIKLGFSWMGVDVMKFDGAGELAEKLAEIINPPGSSQIGTSVIVQSLVPHRVAELRIHSFCVPAKARVPIPPWCRPQEWVPDGGEWGGHCEVPLEHGVVRAGEDFSGNNSSAPAAEEVKGTTIMGGKSEEEEQNSTQSQNFAEYCQSSAMTTLRGFDLKVAYMTIGSPDARGFEMTTHIPHSPEVALHTVWGGDKKLQQKMEDRARVLTRKWLLWYASEWPERCCPANARFDFHVSWDVVGGGEPELFVCEITECGASLCGLPIQARNTALVYSFFEGASAKRKAVLPKMKMCSGGEKEQGEEENGEEEEDGEEEIELQTKWPTGDWAALSTVDKTSSNTWHTWPFGTDARTGQKIL